MIATIRPNIAERWRFRRDQKLRLFCSGTVGSWMVGRNSRASAMISPAKKLVSQGLSQAVLLGQPLQNNAYLFSQVWFNPVEASIIIKVGEVLVW